MNETNPVVETVEESNDVTVETSEPVTYTEEEVASRISKAVNAAIKKVQEKSTKSNEELTQELNDLKSQLARKENESFVSNEINSRGIPAELTKLFYSEDNDVSKEKLDIFSKWFKTAVDSAVEAKLNATETPAFNPSTNATGVKASQDFLSYYAENNK